MFHVALPKFRDMVVIWSTRSPQYPRSLFLPCPWFRRWLYLCHPRWISNIGWIFSGTSHLPFRELIVGCVNSNCRICCDKFTVAASCCVGELYDYDVYLRISGSHQYSNDKCIRGEELGDLCCRSGRTCLFHRYIDLHSRLRIATHIRRQLGFDLWYIFLGLFIICIVESAQIQNQNNYVLPLSYKINGSGLIFSVYFSK